MTSASAPSATAEPSVPVTRAVWLAFATLCLGDLMIVVDGTIVNVALPSIRQALGFTEASLVWVVNAYLLTFGGFLLLGGRLADLYGARRLFIGGLLGFVLASTACGLAPTQEALIAARAAQGIAGAVVSAVALSLTMLLFPEGPGRVKAMALFGFVMAGGGSLGVVAGGLITQFLDWRWVFLVNLPIGLAVTAGALKLLPRDAAPETRPKLDAPGAVMITLASLLAVYGVVGTEQVGWAAPQTWGTLLIAAVLLAAFVAWEGRVPSPLVPLELFRRRNVTLANIISVLWAAGMFAWFFLSALYMQQVLGYGPLGVGLAFLPGNLIMAAFSLWLSAWSVERFGIRACASGGLACAAAGLALFALAPADGTFLAHVLPGMVLTGFGAGLAFNPVLLAAMNDVEPERSGLASGLVNTAFMMGGALGLAVLAAIAAAATGGAAARGATEALALHDGYAAAFWAGAVCAALAGALCLLLKARGPAADAPIAAP